MLFRSKRPHASQSGMSTLRRRPDVRHRRRHLGIDRHQIVMQRLELGGRERAAGRNLRSYLIQSYARDMGNGKTVMMREIDVPIRVQGRHWGGFRTAYKL